MSPKGNFVIFPWSLGREVLVLFPWFLKLFSHIRSLIPESFSVFPWSLKVLMFPWSPEIFANVPLIPRSFRPCSLDPQNPYGGLTGEHEPTYNAERITQVNVKNAFLVGLGRREEKVLALLGGMNKKAGQFEKDPGAGGRGCCFCLFGSSNFCCLVKILFTPVV